MSELRVPELDKPTPTQVERWFESTFCAVEGGMRRPDRTLFIEEEETLVLSWEPEDFKVGFALGAFERDPDGGWTLAPRRGPTQDEVERKLDELCEGTGQRPPDRVEPQANGDYIAYWDEEKLAVVVEMDEAPT